MKYTIEMVEEQVDHILLQETKNSLDILKLNLKERKKDGGMCFFHTDKEQDIKELKRYIEAFKLVYEYYGGN